MAEVLMVRISAAASSLSIIELSFVRQQLREKSVPRLSEQKLGKAANDTRAEWRKGWELFPGSVVWIWHADRYATTVSPIPRRGGPVLAALQGKAALLDGDGPYVAAGRYDGTCEAGGKLGVPTQGGRWPLSVALARCRTKTPLQHLQRILQGPKQGLRRGRVLIARHVQCNEFALPCYSGLGVENTAVELIARRTMPLVWSNL